MLTLDSTATVGQWVTAHPEAARAFEELQVDYCCGGQTTLAEACQRMSLNVEDVLSQLTRTIADTKDEPAENWSCKPLVELCDHIEQTHHVFLRNELPRLTELAEKVVNAHGAGHPELVELQTVFGALRAELEPHMFKEERILFPAIRQLEASDDLPQFPFGTIGNPIRMMEHDHDAVGDALRRIRELTADFQPPDDACNTWRVMLDSLRRFEADTHRHVHKENNILFPRALQLEASRSPSA